MGELFKPVQNWEGIKESKVWAAERDKSAGWAVNSGIWAKALTKDFKIIAILEREQIYNIEQWNHNLPALKVY